MSNSVGRKIRRTARFACSRFACSCMISPESKSGGTPDDGDKHGAVLLDICTGGSCWEANFEPPLGSRLYLDIRPIEGPEVRATIRVVNRRPSTKEGFYIIHSEFIDMSERNRQGLLILLDTIHRLEEGLSCL